MTAVIVTCGLSVGAVAVDTAGCVGRPISLAPIFTRIVVCTIARRTTRGGSAAVARKVFAFCSIRAVGFGASGRCTRTCTCTGRSPIFTDVLSAVPYAAACSYV